MEEEKLCKICGDQAAGTFYKVLACHACKGFFQRTLSGNKNFVCRFGKNCSMDKASRPQCRYCRLKKCYSVGMRRNVIKCESEIKEDLTAKIDSNDHLTLEILNQADQMLLVQSVGTQSEISNRLASIDEFYDSVKDQLLVIAEWMRNIPAFNALCPEDKVALIRYHSGPMLVLGLARRSLTLDDELRLGSGLRLTRNSTGVMSAVCRIMDEIVRPLKSLRIDNTELACFKGIIFSGPCAQGLKDPIKVENLRLQCVLLLEDYITKRGALEASEVGFYSRGRCSELLLTLPSLRSINNCILEEMQMRKFFGLANVHKLLEETLLGDKYTIEIEAEYSPPIKVSPGHAVALMND